MILACFGMHKETLRHAFVSLFSELEGYLTFPSLSCGLIILWKHSKGELGSIPQCRMTATLPMYLKASQLGSKPVSPISKCHAMESACTRAFEAVQTPQYEFPSWELVREVCFQSAPSEFHKCSPQDVSLQPKYKVECQGSCWNVILNSVKHNVPLYVIFHVYI